MPREPDADWQDCIAACHACALACRHCAAACLQEPEVQQLARCIALDTDCAQLCLLAVSLMSGGSEHAPALCRLCAEVCTACANECASHSMDHCRQCAEACRRCAQACRAMAPA